MERIEVLYNWFIFIDYDTEVTFSADNKDELYELIENHYKDAN